METNENSAWWEYKEFDEEERKKILSIMSTMNK